MTWKSLLTSGCLLLNESSAESNQLSEKQKIGIFFLLNVLTDLKATHFYILFVVYDRLTQL